ncbi:MAG: hypothetical protein RIT32_489 [Actinomycetota bacterium]|jgi:pyridoxal phosphate enzyme (YggS family)
MAEIDPKRTAEIESNLSIFLNQLEDQAHNCGRDTAEITVIAVTKGFPAADLLALHSLGIRDFGESRDQEIRSKLAEIAETNFHLHFIGQLQRNKVKNVCSYASAIHSVDRIELVSEMTKLANQGIAVPKILIQVNLDPESSNSRGGTQVNQVLELARVSAESGLTLAGLMAVAPLAADPADAFRRFSEVATEFASEFPGATWRSIGMSTDWRAAVAAGATHLRIGSALLGNRG